MTLSKSRTPLTILDIDSPILLAYGILNATLLGFGMSIGDCLRIVSSAPAFCNFL
jgi:hypothetical protein